ncbi:MULTISPECIES: sporulation protein YqfD [Lysinibacillus]|uniref:Stage IV sporulation protein n=1 Tax=Lysinibacillus antri TaxID=2498145 RepID=A0A432LGF8_9BACI|nr:MULTISPECIES: sporulation protein YqfD [Lysinibacillus]RUL57045.1 stage IV sporulation protein [Lysinibacillus antri]TSI03322.1 stage IV sporulation protein [Lysinibacillus sp. BW-2-10]
MKKFDNRPVEIRMTKNNAANAFIQHLHAKKVKIKNLTHLENEITFEITRKDIKVVRESRKRYRLKIKIRYLQVSRIFQKNSWTALGLLFLILIPIVGSQFIWKVNVEAETPELRVAVEKVINEKLAFDHPTLKGQVKSDFEIRQTIMEQLRDLSWVHIIKTGSSMTIVPQLAPLTDTKENKPKGKNHLVASKSGVVSHFEIASGERRVLPNTTVYTGDTLVSGVITVGDKSIVIGAAGAVYADYWLETDFEIPRKVKYISASNREWIFDFKINNEKEQGKSFQKVDLPKWLSRFIEIKKTQKYITVTQEISEEQLESFILPLLHEKILKSLPPKTIIKKENILHVTFDDDKVKGKVLFLVNENIAKNYPIVQGD